MVAAIAALMVVAGGASWMANGNATKDGTSNQPPLSAPQSPQNEISSGRLSVAGQFAYISPENAPAALKQAGYSQEEQASILAGINRRDYRLAVMPLFDASGTGGTIAVTSGSVRRVVHLTPEPQPIVLPITIAGEVSIAAISPTGPAGITSGAVTVLGPEALPSLQQGETLPLTVIVQ
jgi:hypothetical protein